MKKIKTAIVVVIALFLVVVSGGAALADITVHDKEGFTYDIVTLVARVVDNLGELLVDGPHQVSFKVGDELIGSATVDETGQAQIDWEVDFVPVKLIETYPIEVSFAGNESYEPMVGEGTFTLKSAGGAIVDNFHREREAAKQVFEEAKQEFEGAKQEFFSEKDTLHQQLGAAIEAGDTAEQERIQGELVAIEAEKDAVEAEKDAAEAEKDAAIAALEAVKDKLQAELED